MANTHLLFLLCATVLLANQVLAQGLPPLPEGDTGIAARYAADKDIGNDAAVLWHDDFETGQLPGRYDNLFQRNLVSIAADRAKAHSGDRCIEMTIPRSDKEISNGIVKNLSPAQDVIFIRYYSKFDHRFDAIGSSHNGSYVAAISPGRPMSTPGQKADGKNKFEVAYENWRGDEKTSSPGELNVYCYHPEQRSQYGDHFFPTGLVSPNTSKPGDFGPAFVKRPNIIQKLDQWYCYELMVQANTPGERNGRIACWLDGKLVADFPNLRLRDVPDLKLNTAVLGLHIKNNPRSETTKWYDDFVIATSYIGPMRP